MELKKIEETLRRFLSELQIEYDLEVQEDKVLVTSVIYFKKLADTKATLILDATTNDMAFLTFVFNKVDDLNNVLYHINEFNAKNTEFKGFVDKFGSFVLDSYCYNYENEDGLYYFNYDMFKSLFNDETKELLEPIVKHLINE